MDEIDKNVMGGPGKCKWCEQIVNNVAYHQTVCHAKPMPKPEPYPDDWKSQHDIIAEKDAEIERLLQVIADKTAKIYFDTQRQLKEAVKLLKLGYRLSVMWGESEARDKFYNYFEDYGLIEQIIEEGKKQSTEGGE